MDGTRFDNMTRLFGAGVNRRKVLRGLLGGAGALAVTGATRQFAGAQTCAPPVDCENVQQPACPALCPAGSSSGNNRALDGTCCSGNGQCCSNICSNGICTSDVVPECETPADCGTQPDICTEWLCVEGVCELSGGCPAGELCCPEQGGSCAECCNDSDCPAGAPICYNPGDPTNAYCVQCVGDGDCGPCESCEGNMCTPYAEYCEATDTCYSPMSGGCCPNTQDGCDGCFECVGNTCTPIEDCCSNDDDCTEPCESCVGGTCTPYAEYCPEGDYCYNTGTGGCCTDSDCGDETCVDGHCCPPGDEYCPDGDYCYTPRTGGCCTNADCGDEVCVQGQCEQCPPGEEYCPETGKCYSTMAGGCCTDEQCGDEHCIQGECGSCPPGLEYCPETGECYSRMAGGCCTSADCGNEVCVEGSCEPCPSGQKYCAGTQTCYDPVTQCCTDNDCGPCAYCSELNATCFGQCSQSQSCCDGECVEDEIGCCKPAGDACGLLTVSGASGSPQLDCCDGLVCCDHGDGSHCAECCNDWDCPKGAYCRGGWCEWPDYCLDSHDCPKGTCCCDDGCCSSRCCHHHHHPHPKPTPTTPVTTLPATGVKKGSNDSSTALGITLAAGAAALLGARVLRQPAPETNDEA